MDQRSSWLSPRRRVRVLRRGARPGSCPTTWRAACSGRTSTTRASTAATPSSPTTTAASSTRRGSANPKDKPRVERMVPYVRDSFFSGREFTDLRAMRADAPPGRSRWPGSAARGRSAGPRRRRSSRALEADTLLAAAGAALRGRHLADGQGRPRLPRQRRPAPSTRCRSASSGARLDVRADRHGVQIFARGRAGEDPRARRQGPRATDWQDYPPEKIAFFMRTPSWCRHRAGELGPRSPRSSTGCSASRPCTACGAPRGSCVWPTSTAPNASRPPARSRSRSATPPTAPSRASWPPDREQLEAEPEPTAARRPAHLHGPETLFAPPGGLTHDAAAPARSQAQGPRSSRACSPPSRRASPRRAPANSATWSSSRCCSRTRSRPARGQGRCAERIRRARFEGEATLEEFDFAYNPGCPAPLIRDLAALRFLERGESVLLYGPVGRGQDAHRPGPRATRPAAGAIGLFTKTSRVLADLAGGHADGSWDEPPARARARRPADPRRLRDARASPTARATTSTS